MKRTRTWFGLASLAIMAHSSRLLGSDLGSEKELCRLGDQKTCADLVKQAKEAGNGDHAPVLALAGGDMVLADLAKTPRQNRWETYGYSSSQALAATLLTDQSLLAEVAKAADEEYARVIAAFKLTDQTVLGELAKRDQSKRVRWTAAKRLEIDGLGQACRARNEKSCAKLESWARARVDPKEAEAMSPAAVEKAFSSAAAAVQLVDHTLLAEMASAAQRYWAAMVPLVCISDQGVLADIAKKAKNEDARELAVAMLTNQTLLADIAEAPEGEPGPMLRVAYLAAGRLTDRAALARLAASAAPISVRDVARMRASWSDGNLNDPSSLAAIAKLHPYPIVRKAALGRITDQAELADLVAHESDPGLAMDALGRISEQAHLRKVVEAAVTWKARMTALQRLSDDPETLDAIAKTNTEWAVRLAAAERVNAQTVFADFYAYARGRGERFVWRLLERLDRGLRSTLTAQLRLARVSVCDRGVKLSDIDGIALTGDLSMGQYLQESAAAREDGRPLWHLTSELRYLPSGPHTFRATYIAHDWSSQGQRVTSRGELASATAMLEAGSEYCLSATTGGWGATSAPNAWRLTVDREGADPPVPPAAAPATTAPSRSEGALSASGAGDLCTVLARANALFGLAADWGASREEIMHAWGIEPFTLRKGKRSFSAATLEDGSLLVSVDGAAGVTKRCNRKTGKWE